MDNREIVVTEYFQLRVLLNRTNLKKDERTEVEFLLRRQDQNKFLMLAALRAKGNSKVIEICGKKGDSMWVPSECSGLSNLESHCAHFLNRKTKGNSTFTEIEKSVHELTMELQGLGVSR